MMLPTNAAQIAWDVMEVLETRPASASATRPAMASAACEQVSDWEGLIIATAAEAGYTMILIENLANYGVFTEPRILNPFAGATLSPAAAEVLGCG